jgi:hypothetical protein
MFEPKPNSLTVNYQPDDGSVAEENPPVMVWIPENDYLGCYHVEISVDETFAENSVCYTVESQFNFHRPSALSEGTYYWRYRKIGHEVWSNIRSFIINADSIATTVPDINGLIDNAPADHPRLMAGDARGLLHLKKYAASNPERWQLFKEKSVLPFVGMKAFDEPQPYPNDTRDVSLWRRYYKEAQEYLYVIRHLAVAGLVEDKPEYLTQARDWLLAIASWDLKGASSRHYNDEVGFRVILSLAWGYDWLWNELDTDDRALVKAALVARTKELYEHLSEKAKIHIFPYDSHAIRAISAALVPAAIALKNETDEAQEWLKYSVHYLYALYSPWSGTDGGWGEGPHYWTTAMSYLLDAAQMIKANLGIDLYERPIIKNTGDYPLFVKSPGSKRGYFGDDSTLGELPTLKTAVCMLHLAGATGRSDYHWFYNEHEKRDQSTGKEFYNYGWWDLNFDRMLIDASFDVPEAKFTLEETSVKWFKSIGSVGIQHKLDRPEEHLQFTIKSSPLGSVSHSSGDQGAFVIYGFEEDLAIHSGYYVSYGSKMHMDWRKQTRSKNALLIDGEGQYAGTNKIQAKKSNGQVLDVKESDGCIEILTDSTPAYQSLNDSVQSVKRNVYFVDSTYFLIVDVVECSSAVPIQIRQHSEQPFLCSTKSMASQQANAGIEYSIAYSSSPLATVSSTDGFDGIPKDEYEGLPMNYVGEFEFSPAKTHRVVTLIHPYRRGNKGSLYTFVDDQGFNLNVYVTDEHDRSYRLEVPK